ncbi:MAG: hypothetical protein Q9223_001524 [Gallowayella weberi]
MSRVMDTPKDRITRRDKISPPHTDTQYGRSSSDRDAPEEDIQVPRSPVPPAEVKDKNIFERSTDLFMAPQSKARSGAPKSLPDTILATQELPQRSQQDHTRKIMKLSGDWVGLLKDKAAKTPLDRRVDVDGDHVHCQCHFFGEEGEMVRIRETPWRNLLLEKLKDLARTRRSLWMLFGQEPPSSQSGLKRRLGKLHSSVTCRLLHVDTVAGLQDGNAAAQLVRRLKEEGFLQPVRGTKLVRSISPTQAGKRHQIYGNPMTLIEDCYES